nr:E3 ubiquitin-protein ligase Mdm2 [Salvelinus alpinus]
MAENCERMAEWHRSSSQINTLDNEKLVRPKEKLHILLQQAGADKDIFTRERVIFYLGQYIMKKQLYDMKQQHIVHCADDPLGAVLGVDSFSVKEPRVLFAMITTKSPRGEKSRSQSVFTEPRSQSEPDRGPKVRTSCDSVGQPPVTLWVSHPVTLWPSLLYSVAAPCDSCGQPPVTLWGPPANVTIFEQREEDSCPMTTTEITEADYWKCSQCEELNPPLPRNCNRCWTRRMDWFPESDSNSATTTTIAPNLKPFPPKPSPAPTEPDETEGLDVPDGKRARSPLPLLKDSQDLVSVSGPDSQDSACSSQPSTSSSNSNVVGSCSSSSAPFSQEVMAPDLERFNSLEAHLPASCLEPCVICQTRPKNGCIVHGRTGHLMACYTCARKLKKRNKLCPVCREPIQSVVLIYLS